MIILVVLRYSQARALAAWARELIPSSGPLLRWSVCQAMMSPCRPPHCLE